MDWLAEPYAPETLEVRAMFGDDGNFADYWLSRYGPSDERGWFQAEDIVRQANKVEVDAWTSELDTMVTLMSRRFDGGGGLTGSTPLLVAVRDALLFEGEMLLRVERGVKR